MNIGRNVRLDPKIPPLKFIDVHPFNLKCIYQFGVYVPLNLLFQKSLSFSLRWCPWHGLRVSVCWFFETKHNVHIEEKNSFITLAHTRRTSINHFVYNDSRSRVKNSVNCYFVVVVVSKMELGMNWLSFVFKTMIDLSADVGKWLFHIYSLLAGPASVTHDWINIRNWVYNGFIERGMNTLTSQCRQKNLKITIQILW